MKLRHLAIAAVTLPLALHADPETFLIGTGGKDAKGIYAAEFDPDKGTISNVRLAAEAESPGFLDFHPSLPVVYAIGGKSVAAFKYDSEGKLTLINRVECGDGGTCHLEVHPSGKGLAAANYGGGSLSTFLLDDDGSIAEPAKVIKFEGLSVNKQRQTAPHAHGTHFLGDLLLVPDLGTDKVMLYKFDPRAGNEPRAADPASVQTLPGDGPRHATFHPSGEFAFVNHELTGFVEAYRIEGEKLSSTSRVSTLPDDFEGNNTTAEIVVHPGGKWVFVSNRGYDSIAVFAFDEKSGELTRKAIVPCGAATPRHFSLTPDGRWLLVAGQSSGDLHVMSFDPGSGELKLTESTGKVPSPICIQFVPGQD